MNPTDSMSQNDGASRRGSGAFAVGIWFGALFLAGLAAALRLWRLSTAEGAWDVVNLIYDDAYYYLTLAANMLDSGRSTIDGATLTNGYQPLWFILICALGLITGTDSLMFFDTFVFFVSAIAVIAVVFGFPMGRRDRRMLRSALAVGISVGAVLWSNIYLSGMETILFLPLLIPLIILMEVEPNRRRALMLSGVFALAFLVRLDALVLVPSFILVTAIIEPAIKRRSPRKLIADARRSVPWLLAVVGLAVVAYAALNFAIYGTPVPVSGIAKSIGPRFENWEILVQYADYAKKLVPLVVTAAVIEFLAYRSGIRSTALLRSMAVCVLACLLQATYYVAASTWKLWDWYFYLVGFVLILLIARIVIIGAELWKREKSLPAAALLAIVIIVVAHAARVDLQRTLIQPNPAPGALGADANLLDSGRVFTYNEISLIMLRDFFSTQNGISRVAMGDRAGGLSYWGRGDVEVVHTEGLLLGYPYIEARRSGAATSYLENEGIAYFVVDRDRIHAVHRSDGETIYLVVDPIQALRTDAGYHVAQFCFPEGAIRYRLKYERSTGPTVRAAFAFDERVECTAHESSVIREAIAKSILRQESLPNEYN